MQLSIDHFNDLLWESPEKLEGVQARQSLQRQNRSAFQETRGDKKY
jgi:hypothetical protein